MYTREEPGCAGINNVMSNNRRDEGESIKEQEALVGGRGMKVLANSSRSHLSPKEREPHRRCLSNPTILMTEGDEVVSITYPEVFLSGETRPRSVSESMETERKRKRQSLDRKPEVPATKKIEDPLATELFGALSDLTEQAKKLVALIVPNTGRDIKFLAERMKKSVAVLDRESLKGWMEDHRLIRPTPMTFEVESQTPPEMAIEAGKADVAEVPQLREQLRGKSQRIRELEEALSKMAGELEEALEAAQLTGKKKIEALSSALEEGLGASDPRFTQQWPESTFIKTKVEHRGLPTWGSGPARAVVLNSKQWKKAPLMKSLVENYPHMRGALEAGYPKPGEVAVFRGSQTGPNAEGNIEVKKDLLMLIGAPEGEETASLLAALKAVEMETAKEEDKVACLTAIAPVQFGVLRKLAEVALRESECTLTLLKGGPKDARGRTQGGEGGGGKAPPRKTLLVQGESYANMARALKSNLPAERKAEIADSMKTRSGAMRVTLGKGVDQVTFERALKAAVGEEATIRRGIRKSLLIFPDVDETTTLGELEDGLAASLGRPLEDGECRLKARQEGLLLATALLPKEDADKLAGRRRIRVGLGLTRVKLVQQKKQRCTKCLVPGHIAANCKGADRSKCCRRCGKKDHKEAGCENDPVCFTCRDAGKEDTAHATGDKRCPASGINRPAPQAPSSDNGGPVTKKRRRMRIKCLRCLGYGHVRAACTGAERSTCCRRCGNEGHKAEACPLPARCMACSDAGHKDIGHRSGGKACVEAWKEEGNGETPQVMMETNSENENAGGSN